MIALDTNVLVRYLVQDNEQQAEVARALLQDLTPQSPGFICREVVLEVAWVLERAYGFARAQIADVLIEIIATDSLVVETTEDVVQAAIQYRQGGADFSDFMILAAAKRAEARPLYTFDRKLARAAGATLIQERRL